MPKSFRENIESTADDMRNQYRDLRIDTFLLFLQTSDVLKRYLDLQLKDKTITRAGFTVLNTLVLYGGSMLQTEIGNKIFRTRHSISRAILTLEKHGLVVTNTVGEDRRKREVQITIKGLTIAKQGNIYARERIARDILSILNEEETQSLNQNLKKLREQMLTLIGK